MDGDEWEILELAGAYLFVVSLVPIAWYAAEPEPVQLVRADDNTVFETWWKKNDPKTSVPTFFDARLIREDGSEYLNDLKKTAWTDQNRHRIELWRSETDGVVHLDVHIDARYSYGNFLAKIVEFATRADCLFFFKHEEVFVRPTSIAVFEALARSPAAALASGKSPLAKAH